MNLKNEREIVFNPVDGSILASDFAPFRALEGDSACVQDIIDTENEQAFYRVIGCAMGSPVKQVESNTVFRGAQVHVCVSYADSPEPRIRVLVRQRRKS